MSDMSLHIIFFSARSDLRVSQSAYSKKVLFIYQRTMNVSGLILSYTGCILHVINVAYGKFRVHNRMVVVCVYQEY